MKLSATLCVSFVALAGFVYVTNGALAEPPDPCKTGCKTSHGHATSYLNPQPLPPGVKGPGHGQIVESPAVSARCLPPRRWQKICISVPPPPGRPPSQCRYTWVCR